MDLFSKEFIILLLASFISYYLLYLINRLAKKTIIPQWVVLLIASLVFYGFNNYVYLIYLGFSFIVTYLTSILTQYKLFNKDSSNKTKFHPLKIDKSDNRKVYEKALMIIAIIINVSVLLVLKYYNFFASSVNSVFHASMVTVNFIIPIGISFYTFSLIAYNVDCYKRDVEAETNPLKFLLFVSYFPKIFQGPISSYEELKKDGLFSEHSFTDNDYLKSFFRIAIGLVKKLAIANVINLYVNASYANLSEIYGLPLVLTTLLYAIELYCDFSGFMDIAIGVSGLFGIKLEENFNTPYLSSSIQEFWRRWHITLGNWLKKYIYIPLGGNRVPIWRWIINTLIVWLISGLWHGANWTFIVWGLLHGVLLVITALPKQIKKSRGMEIKPPSNNPIIKSIKVVVTFLFVCFGWIFFRAPDLREALRYIWHMMRLNIPSTYNLFTDPNLVEMNKFLAISMTLVTLLVILKVISLYQEKIISFMSHKVIFKKTSLFMMTTLLVMVSIFVFISLKAGNGEASSFIYFDF